MRAYRIQNEEGEQNKFIKSVRWRGLPKRDEFGLMFQSRWFRSRNNTEKHFDLEPITAHGQWALGTSFMKQSYGPCGTSSWDFI